MPPVSPLHTAIPNKSLQTSPFQTVPPPYVPPTSSQQPAIPNRSPQTSPFRLYRRRMCHPYHRSIQQIPNRPPQQSMPQQPAQSMDMEQKFGRMVMGILASVFVFAAILIGYAFLPGWMQAVGLYIIGIAVSAIGLYGIEKKNYRYFFLSVAGCGAGILYLSIFLSYWYFSVIGKWAMYGMLLLWAVLVLWISRKGVPLFPAGWTVRDFPVSSVCLSRYESAANQFDLSLFCICLCSLSVCRSKNWYCPKPLYFALAMPLHCRFCPFCSISPSEENGTPVRFGCLALVGFALLFFSLA